MQVRWNYKLLPNKTQEAKLNEWLITLRKHRNYMLRERKDGFDNNNQNSDRPIIYAWGSLCDIESRSEWGSCCPLTCPILKHGVIPDGIELTKTTKEKVNKKTGEITPSQVKWGSFSDIQSKATTKLRKSNNYYSRIDSDVLQRNIAKLDTAYSNFWKYGRGFPSFRKASNFKSFEYKPRRCRFYINRTEGKKHRYSKVYLPGIGEMRYFDSRPIPNEALLRTVTVLKEADGWHMSVLLNLPHNLPRVLSTSDVKGIRGLDVGINKLASFSDGSFAENKRFAKKQTRRLRIRQRRVSRKNIGSKNRSKAGKAVAKLHRKVKMQRDAYNWKVAHQAHRKVNAVAHEDLNVQGMKKRCKPNKVKGRFLLNGQSAKRGLNRAISDASWSDLFQKIGWIGAKLGHRVIKVNPAYTSQKCRKCGYVSKFNRDGEKFVCESCGHTDHADIQAARSITEKAGLVFPRKNQTTLPGDSRKVTLVSDSARKGRRIQGKNPSSKAMPESGISEAII